MRLMRKDQWKKSSQSYTELRIGIIVNDKHKPSETMFVPSFRILISLYIRVVYLFCESRINVFVYLCPPASGLPDLTSVPPCSLKSYLSNPAYYSLLPLCL